MSLNNYFAFLISVYITARFSQNVTEATVREEIEKYIPQIIKFVDKHVSVQDQQRCTAR